MTTFTRLDSARHRRTPWKNGGGVTVDIAGASVPGVAPGAWEGMIWRFGRTRIERPGPFSDLSGFDRLLAVVEGQGLYAAAGASTVELDGDSCELAPADALQIESDGPIAITLSGDVIAAASITPASLR